MAKCTAVRDDGSRCRAQALKNGEHCFMHDPGSGAARAQARRRGGERRRVGHAGDISQIPSQVRSMTDVMGILDYALTEALSLENSIQRGRLLVAVCAAFGEAIKTGELESRVIAIERSISAGEEVLHESRNENLGIGAKNGR